MRAAILVGLALLPALGAGAWPLDGYEATGIPRLEAYQRTAEALLASGRLKTGSLLPTEAIALRLSGRDVAIPEPDPELGRKIVGALGADAPAYSVALLDLTDLSAPRYAEHQADRIQNPGSVGKILVALAWFQALADRYPDDPDARHRLLYDTPLVADEFIVSDHHTVPIYAVGDPKVVRRPMQQGDRGNLWTFLDWMASVSSNAAASMLMSELLVMRGLGERYPVGADGRRAFFAETPKAELGELWLDSILGPLERNGIDREALRQGSLFTRTGKQKVPGTNSVATARELMKFLIRMEQGRLVDEWSSLQLKRLLYLTDRRIRYASHPALNDSAVYYKSGSLYSCREEAGFTCKKYAGNVRNFMNSVAIVETESDGRRLHYLVVVLSNVLRKNSAVEHQTLGMRIHRLVESLHPAAPAADPPGPAADAPTPAADPPTPTGAGGAAGSPAALPGPR